MIQKMDVVCEWILDVAGEEYIKMHFVKRKNRTTRGWNQTQIWLHSEAGQRKWKSANVMIVEVSSSGNKQAVYPNLSPAGS
jgi:hypothetical protein